jgi:uncharacterized membrane protein YfcA
MEQLGFFALGLVTATLAVVVGVGGGVVYVPALTTLFGFAQREAQGTSLSVIAPAALIATVANHRAGRVNWTVAIGVAVGAVIGAVGGSQVAQRLDETVLQRLFATLLVVTAVRMVLRARNA